MHKTTQRIFNFLGSTVKFTELLIVSLQYCICMKADSHLFFTAAINAKYCVAKCIFTKCSAKLSMLYVQQKQALCSRRLAVLVI